MPDTSDPLLNTKQRKGKKCSKMFLFSFNIVIDAVCGNFRSSAQQGHSTAVSATAIIELQ